MDGIPYAMDLEIPAAYNKRDDEDKYVPDQQELDRRQRIVDEYNAKQEETRKMVEERNLEIAKQGEDKRRNADIEEYMRFYPVSREVATANLEWFRSEGRTRILNQMSDYSRSIF